MTEATQESMQRAAAAEAQREPAAYRLIIRARILPDEPTKPPASRPLSRRSLAIIVALTAAVGLGWLGYRALRPDAATSPPPSEVAQQEAAVSPASAASSASSTPVAPGESRTNSSAASSSSPSPNARNSAPHAVNEVLPDVSESALQTIRGTIRVLIGVRVDASGAVFSASADVPGPSKYFARKSLEAARQWTFAPSASKEQRSMRVQFNYTRSGVTAELLPKEAR